jgi:hypothetical protein
MATIKEFQYPKIEKTSATVLGSYEWSKTNQLASNSRPVFNQSKRGGFLRPFGCGWFIREFLLVNGPQGSTIINPKRGAPQADINFVYEEALARATARDRAK